MEEYGFVLPATDIVIRGRIGVRRKWVLKHFKKLKLVENNLMKINSSI
jgi:hypothetical protein